MELVGAGTPTERESPALPDGEAPLPGPEALGDAPDGRTPDGRTPDGEAPDGDEPLPEAVGTAPLDPAGLVWAGTPTERERPTLPATPDGEEPKISLDKAAEMEAKLVVAAPPPTGVTAMDEVTGVAKVEVLVVGTGVRTMVPGTTEDWGLEETLETDGRFVGIPVKVFPASETGQTVV